MCIEQEDGWMHKEEQGHPPYPAFEISKIDALIEYDEFKKTLAGKTERKTAICKPPQVEFRKPIGQPELIMTKKGMKKAYESADMIVFDDKLVLFSDFVSPLIMPKARFEGRYKVVSGKNRRILIHPPVLKDGVPLGLSNGESTYGES